jgi:citronellyl-CoA synthetase
MGVRELFSTAKDLGTVLSARKHLKLRPPETVDSIAQRVEENAVRFADRTMIKFEGRTLTWHEFNTLANRYARTLKAQGVGPGDAVSVLMENRPEMLASIVALSKLGAAASLINTNLRGRPLTHCVSVTASKRCIVGEELAHAIGEVKGDLSLAEGRDFLFVPDAGKNPAPNWALDLAGAARSESTTNLDDSNGVIIGDPALYIFTSGTTGLPKAAVVSGRRFLATAAATCRAGLRSDENDCVYVCLPLYHGTGLLLGFGSTLYSGSSLFVRRKFSASRFLSEVREHQTTCMVYIGELCRYLMHTPERPNDADNPLERVMGNGLRPDVWMGFKQRFGIERITEFYGASEGNVSFVNLLNKDCTIGMTANKIALVKYDVDADALVRDAEGKCLKAEKNEPGLLLAQINAEQVFEGYTNAEATEKKIVRNAFEQGDAWFNSGDLIKRIDAGFTFGIPHYQFVDRVGDTFRWKSENVSTNEVGEIINQHPQVDMCNVYGVEVPNADGRAGMAAVVLKEGQKALDLESFYTFVTRELPAYARPVFVRIEHDMDVTGTFKMVKGDLRKQGYDVRQITDPVYVLKPSATKYERLDAAYLDVIRSGKAGF